MTTPTGLQLDDSATIVLDASGNGTARVGPRTPNQVWGSTIHVSVSAQLGTSGPLCSLYLGTPSPGNLLDSTFTGNGDSIDLSLVLAFGQFLTAQWTNGVPSTSATISVTGDRSVKSR